MKTIPIGIDLGTTNCCISWLDGNDVHVYKDDAGLFTIPSIVSQLPDGEIIAGWQAKRCSDPLYRHGFAKRYLGTDKQFPLQGGSVYAWEISKHLLSHLKKCAESAVGGPVSAVITYPAHFSQVQIGETRRAAEGAELKVIDLLTEPVAAAIASKHQGRLNDTREEQLIEVYDMGGGTTDVSVCRSRGDRIEVSDNGRAYDGDNFLGGVDFDKALVGLAAEQLKKQGMQLVSLSNDLPTMQWLWELMTSAERCKEKLSDEMEVQWKQELKDGGTGNIASLNMWISRRKFEAEIRHTVEKTLAFCDSALLKHAGFEFPDGSDRQQEALGHAAIGLAQVILVGGSTRVPLVRELVKAHHRSLGAENVLVGGFREDECVAMGAAVYAAGRPAGRSAVAGTEWLSWKVQPPDRVSADVTIYPELLGIAASGAQAGWTIHYRIGATTGSAPVAEGGNFSIPPFSLQAGENPLELELCDPRGEVRARHASMITRGGLSIGEPGLAHPIKIRLVEGLEELVPAGTRAGSSSEKHLYTNERIAEVRAPLYEGHLPIANFQFSATAEAGTPVVIRTIYSRQRLEVEMQIGDGEPLCFPVDLKASSTRSDMAQLQTHYEELVERIQYLLEKLPAGSALRRLMEKEWTALRLDLEMEFGNRSIRDDARIDDRLRQLEMLGLRLQAFAATPDGLRERVNSVRQQARTAGADAELMRELDDIEARIPQTEDVDLLAALDSRLYAVSNNLTSRHASDVPPEALEHVTKHIRTRLESIRRDGGSDPAVLAKLKDIDAFMDRLLTANADYRPKLNRLLLYEYEMINPLYQAVVIRRGQQGLLRSTPK